MSASPSRTPVSLRIVLFTDIPQVAAFYSQFMPAQGHTIVGVVTSRKRNDDYVAVVGNAPATADVLVSDRPRRWAAMLAPLRPDVIISTVFPWRLPQDVIELPTFGAINLHPSMLPRYRGTMTPNWTFLNDERTSGLTAHRMVADFDAGPILAQVEMAVTDDDDLMSYMQRLFGHAPAIIDTAIQRVVAGDPGDMQDDTQATYFGALPEEQRHIDWNGSARRVHNQVRAFGGFVKPLGAFASIDGVPTRILRTRLSSNSSANTDVTPGTVISRNDDGLMIQCGDGVVEVLQYEPQADGA